MNLGRSFERFIFILIITVVVTVSAATNGQAVYTSAEVLLKECGKASWRNNEDCVFHFSVLYTSFELIGGKFPHEGVCFPRDFVLRKPYYIVQLRDAVIRRLKSARPTPTDLSAFEMLALSQQWPCIIGEQAEKFSLQTIKNLCESSRRENRLQCDQYLTWVEEEYQFQQFKYRSCVPTEASEEDLRLAFLDHVRDRRLSDDEVGAEIALEALTVRWPCG